ncbi:DNA cytosine methyltransferase [Brevundimonas sp. TWP2-3-4b1]|uniref:DNA cytosine methyltransferase n=1 Tax=Brevundimonas sp. TWP2-3-4b1 TaxID=2804580 RepID=UPI003CEBB5E9
MTLKLIDLFSGAGGMSLGFRNEGIEPILALDNDAAAVGTHKANFDGEAYCANIEEWLETAEVPFADVVIGGPPCQGFSLLNKMRTGDSRRALWEPYLEIANRSQARVFIMENVAELFRSPELEDIRAKAAEYGFETKAGVVNAADYGAPQTRKRTIVVGWRNIGEPDFPPRPTHADPGKKLNLPPWRTVRQVIGDLPAPVGTEIGVEAPMNLHFGRTPTDRSIARYKAVPIGGNRFDLQRNAPELTPDCWIRKTSGGTDLFGRLWWDRPSVTIRTEFFKPEKGRYLHPDQNRPITHREAARIMGFPDDFVFVGNKTHIARQIGNAVPPALAAALGRMVMRMLNPLAMSA